MASIDFRKEQKREHILRDVRTPTQRFKDSLLETGYPYLWLGMAAAGSLILNPIAEAFLLGGYLITNSAITKQRRAGMPCTYPKSAKKLDPKLVNQKGEWQLGDGIFYCGVDRHTGRELWISGEQFKRHSFFFGTTGSGKTEFLLSVMLNSLIQGSSYIFIDGKGDIKLYYSAYSQARALGREHDILLLNFLTGEKDILGAQDSLISNTFNYFGAGNSDAATQTTNSIIDAEEDIWGKRATSTVEALMKPLVFKRSEFNVNLDAEVVRSYFSINQLERLFLIEPFMYDGLIYTLSGIKNYFVNLPDWNITRSTCYDEFLNKLASPNNVEQMKLFRRMNPDLWIQIEQDFNLTKSMLEGNEESAKKREDSFKGQTNTPNSTKGQGQVSETMLQHGYITMQLVQVFNSLADTYGYIMRTSCPDIDMRDVILSRRILIALLPALAKSPAELKNLGRILLSVTKTAMTTGLGYKAEGDTTRIIHTRPTDAETPIPIVADECGVYLINGAFVLPAQGRSLGVGMVFAAQDITALLQNLDKETYSVLGNTVNKFCGKLDDKESAEYFENLAGEGKFAVLGGFKKNDADGHSFKQSDEVNLESIKRVSFNDLRSHTAGHWHYFFGNDIFYIQSFYANTRTVSYLRVNHFLDLATMGSEEYFAIERITEQMNYVLNKPTSSASTLSKYINAYLKPQATVEKENDAAKFEGVPREFLPKEWVASSALVGQMMLNSELNKTYHRGLKQASELFLSLDEDYLMPESAIGMVEYTPHSLPADMNFKAVKEFVEHCTFEAQEGYRNIRLHHGEADENAFNNSSANVFNNELCQSIFGAALSGKPFLTIIKGQENKAIIEQRAAANKHNQSVKQSFTAFNNGGSIAVALEELTNPHQTPEQNKAIAEKSTQLTAKQQLEFLTYSSYKEEDSNVRDSEQTKILFDELVETLIKENPTKLH